MSFELFRDVILTVDIPDQGLCAGDVGTVVEHHEIDNKPDGYSVEFFDMTGRTITVVCLPEDHLRTPTPDDRPNVRTESASRQ